MGELKIGEVVLLQVQQDTIKFRDGYDPTAILRVEEASVDGNGMLGWNGSGWVVDVHHSTWPNPGPRRPLSIGFSSHYERMRVGYRNLPLGDAGENIIVRTERLFALEDLGERIVVRGFDREAVFHPIKVAKPCLQFTSYMLELPEVGSHEALKEHLAYFGAGTRGFILAMDEETTPTRLRLGDEVFVG